MCTVHYNNIFTIIYSYTNTLSKSLELYAKLCSNKRGLKCLSEVIYSGENEANSHHLLTIRGVRAHSLPHIHQSDGYTSTSSTMKACLLWWVHIPGIPYLGSSTTHIFRPIISVKECKTWGFMCKLLWDASGGFSSFLNEPHITTPDIYCFHRSRWIHRDACCMIINHLVSLVVWPKLSGESHWDLDSLVLFFTSSFFFLCIICIYQRGGWAHFKPSISVWLMRAEF